MIDVAFILSKLPVYQGTSKVITSNQSVKDIKKAILQSFELDKKQYAAIAPYFVGKTVYDTCLNVFDFLRKNVINVTEGIDIQSVKNPAAILATGNTTGSDCKNYSLFVAGVLDAINRSGLQKIPIAFRFCKYQQFDGSMLDHVFIVVYPNRKNEIWIDCIKDVKYFDCKDNPPNFYTDKKINSMALVRVSGMPVKLSNKEIINGLISERNKRIQNGQIKAGSVQDKRYTKALATMGVFDPSNITLPTNLPAWAEQANNSGGGVSNFLQNFGGNSFNMASILSGDLDVGKVLSSGVATAANVLLPGSGALVQPLINLFSGIFGGKGGYYEDWSKDADGGLAEVVRWTRNDGDDPKRELDGIIRLFQEKGIDFYLNKPTRYGDAPLTINDVVGKMQRNGMSSQAAQLVQKLQPVVNSAMPVKYGVPNVDTSANGSNKISPLLLVGGAFVTGKLFKLF